MAPRHEDDGAEESSSLIDRRSYVKLAGAVGLAALTGATATAGTTAAEVDADEVVDLGEQGLSEGDRIDPYIEEYFQSGTEVRVPAGEYEWAGSGFTNYDLSEAAVIGDGEVVFNMASDRFYQNVQATSGKVELRNFTVRGAVPGESRMRLETGDDDGHIVVDNVNFPDGSVDDAERSQCWYVPPEHHGVIELRNIYVEGFSDNGVYASPPGKGGGGQVIIENSVARNNNITGFRIGGQNSRISNCLVINDARSPVPAGIGHNQRGIRIDESQHSKDILVENCDVIHSSTNLGGGGPMRWSPRAGGSTGHIENVRILNNNSIAAINPVRDLAQGWSGDEIHVTGDGNHDVPSWFTNVHTGDDANAPSRDSPQNGDGDSGNGDDSNDGGSGSDGASGTELQLLTNDSDSIEFEFTTSGQITPLFDADENPADTAEPADTATENDDGTWTGQAVLAGASNGDTFRYEGEVLDVSMAGDYETLTILRNGTEVSADELVSHDGDSGNSDGSDDSSDGGGSGNGDGSDDGSDGSNDDGSDGSSGNDDPSDGDGSSGDDGDGSSGDDGDDSSGDDGDDQAGTGELPNLLIVDGTANDDVTQYQFSVTGEVTRDSGVSTVPEDALPWDELGDDVEESDVIGIVGKGVDGYRYSGELVDFEFDGAAVMTVERSQV